MEKMKNKVVLITGASRGLGAALAHRFAQEKATLILLAKSIQGLEKLDAELDQYNIETILVPVDLQQFDKLISLPSALGERFGRLDILIGNAAILGGLSPLTHYTPVQFQKIFDINVTANPRAIFVTSGASHSSMPFWGPYAASKASLECLIQTFAAEQEHTPWRINLVDPGVMATNLFHEAMPGIDLSTIKPPSESTNIFLEIAQDDYPHTGQIVKA
jgi:NAD(P)-dependent dehydrogenase (short-subunit alcohol dehydrogenase family)